MKREENKLKKFVIKCPYCGAEYTPDEIFIADHILGKSKDIVKDPVGKILYNDYQEKFAPDFEERFICDKCNNPFRVWVTMTFRSRKENTELNFNDQDASLLD